MSERAKEVIYRYHKDLFSLQHVIGVGYGVREKRQQKTGEKALVVLVDKKVPQDKLSSHDIVPQHMENYKTDVQEIGDVQFLNNNRTQKMRPAQPGVSIGHYKISAGTLGGIVKDKKTGQKLILSNNHVLANITNGQDSRSKKGDPVLQPGTYDGGDQPEDVIGHLERFIPIVRGSGSQPTCPIAIIFERLANLFLHMVRQDYSFKLYKDNNGNLVDCAVAKPVNENDLSQDIIGLGEVKGVKEPELGMSVVKSGRTSGITRGKINLIDATIQVRMNEDEVAVFHDQFVTDPMSKPGDSGSVVLDQENNAVGLLFAGSEKATVCNWMVYVLDALNIEF